MDFNTPYCSGFGLVVQVWASRALEVESTLVLGHGDLVHNMMINVVLGLVPEEDPAETSVPNISAVSKILSEYILKICRNCRV